MLWVLIRSALSTHNIMFLWRNKKNYPRILCNKALKIFGYMSLFCLALSVTLERKLGLGNPVIHPIFAMCQYTDFLLWYKLWICSKLYTSWCKLNAGFSAFDYKINPLWHYLMIKGSKPLFMNCYAIQIYIIYYLITTHILISNFVIFKLQLVYFYLLLFKSICCLYSFKLP